MERLKATWVGPRAPTLGREKKEKKGKGVFFSLLSAAGESQPPMSLSKSLPERAEVLAKKKRREKKPKQNVPAQSGTVPARQG
jgi:hypothetical protein